MNLTALTLLLGKANNRALLERLLQAGTELVIIGGTALAFHDLRDVANVDDLDLLINPTAENAERVVSVLHALGSPLQASAGMLARPGKQVPLKSGSYWAELLTPVQGVEFREVYASAIVANVPGIPVRVASTEHLRRMKQLAVNELRASLEKHENDLRRLGEA